MPGSVSIIEAKGQPTIPADADFAACVIGYTTLNPLGAGPGPVSPQYSAASSLASAWGLGDAVDCACQGIVTSQGNPSPPPAAICQTPATTPGVRGDLDTSDVTGTAVITQTATTHPVGTYEPVCRVADDGNDGEGGLIGTAGIYLEFSPDGGRTWLPRTALGTALTIKMQIDGQDTGVQYDFAPATTNAAYVTLTVELRADTLAHLANAVAHDGADTSAAQVLLAASSVPATVSASNAVVLLVYNALVSHVVNITSVHDGPDLVARAALATLSALAAATDTKSRIDLAIALKGIINTHLGVALTASTAGLMGATASVASPQTYTSAANFLAGGVSALDAQPRRLKITISGSGTPADMSNTVDLSGFDYADNAQTETGLDLTALGTIISTKAWKGTGLSAAFATGQGTGASFQLGYSNGVHNSADSTNTISSPDPTYGTLFTGDQWTETKTTPPMWAISDLYTAGDPASGAFGDIAKSSTSFAIVIISEPVTAGNITTLTAALNYLAGFGKRPSLLVRFRDPAAGETDAQYIAAFQTFRASIHDNRISPVAGSGWLTDAFRGYVYFRSGLPALFARMQSFAVIPGARGERMAQHPGYGARGPLEGFSLVDTAGQPISQAHDEALAGGIDGPIGGAGGGITFFYQRRTAIAGTYVSDAPVAYPPLSQILTWMDRRVANGIETTAEAIAWTKIQGADIFDPVTRVLDDDIVNAIQGDIGKAIRDRYRAEFQNAEDPNLVVINPVVTVNGSRVSIAGTVNWRPYGYTHDIALTFSATR